MITIEEQRQRLDFDDSWVAVKWDKTDEHKAMSAISGVKAADIVAARHGHGAGTLLLVEVKDFVHPDIPEDQRAEKALQAVSHNLIPDLVRKVTDTLCGATFAVDVDGERLTELELWRSTVGAERPKLLVVFCIEGSRDRSIMAKVWTTTLKKQLRWLGLDARVLVTDRFAPFNHAGVAYRVDQR